MKSIVAMLVLGPFGLSAVAAPLLAPTITVAATDIKQLQFDITPVPTIGWYSSRGSAPRRAPHG